MNKSAILLGLLLVYNAYHSLLFKVALNFLDSHPDLPQLDALLGLVTIGLQSIGVLDDLSVASQQDLHLINAHREVFKGLVKNGIKTAPKYILDCAYQQTCSQKQISIKAQVDGRSIPILVLQRNVTRSKPKRAIVYFHAGGSVVGVMDGPMAFVLAAQVDAVVFSIGYRKSPEHIYPAGVDDCFEAVKWVVANADKYVQDLSKLTLAGDSAGSMFAAATAQRWKDMKESPSIHQLILVIPMLGPVLSRSYARYADIHLLPMRQMAFYWDMYTENIYDCVVDPVCSPVSASIERLKGIADRALLIPARADVLFDEAKEYARKLKLAGVQTDFAPVRGTHIGVFLFSEKLRSGELLHSLE